MILKNMRSVPGQRKQASYVVRFYQTELSNLSFCKILKKEAQKG